MQHTDSIYAAELTLRGFDAWVEESTTAKLNERIVSTLAPAYLCLTMRNLDITFVYDENLVLWAAVGIVDLSDLGFTELVFDENEPPRVLN